MIAVKLHIQNLIAAHVHWSTKKGHIFKTMDPKLQLFLGIHFTFEDCKAEFYLPPNHSISRKFHKP
jgi:hypothetical protein